VTVFEGPRKNVSLSPTMALDEPGLCSHPNRQHCWSCHMSVYPSLDMSHIGFYLAIITIHVEKHWCEHWCQKNFADCVMVKFEFLNCDLCCFISTITMSSLHCIKS